MVYCVTGVTASPSLTFKSESRHTAEGARDLAATFLSSGLREVEIRDSDGNLQSLRDLERQVERDASRPPDGSAKTSYRTN